MGGLNAPTRAIVDTLMPRDEEAAVRTAVMTAHERLNYLLRCRAKGYVAGKDKMDKVLALQADAEGARREEEERANNGQIYA